MDRVLDGAATPAEVRELDRLLAADPTARTEFEQIRTVFDGLRDMPQAFPPEGLVARVLSNIPQNRGPRSRPDQLSSRSGVIGSAIRQARGVSPGNSVKGTPAHPPVPHSREWNMNEQGSGSRRRNVWIGSGIAIAAALVALAYTIDFPPGAQNVVGTIVPAQRFKAAQPAMGDIKPAGSSASQAVPLQAGSAANAAANNAVVSGTTNATVNANNTNNLVNMGTGNNSVAAGQTPNAVLQSSTNAAIAGATVNATTAGQTNKAMDQAATANAISGATAVNAQVNATTMNAVVQSTSNAINSSVQQGVTNATQK